jgi:hypothetical protein
VGGVDVELAQRIFETLLQRYDEARGAVVGDERVLSLVYRQKFTKENYEALSAVRLLRVLDPWITRAAFGNQRNA